MGFGLFRSGEIATISEALHIAEDKTGDFFKFSFGQWKRHRYDVKTVSAVTKTDMTPAAFAALMKYSGVPNNFNPKAKNHDFYIICLQDHQILKALKRDRELNLLPLLVYIFTHELVHIIRFCNFFQRFEISGDGREKEEKIVHTTTFDILKSISLPKMAYILDSYQNHRFCDLVVS